MDGCREIPVTEQVSKRKIQIMGIVNLTDDSYFAPSRCLGPDGRSDMKKVLGRVSRMLEEGADIIDRARNLSEKRRNGGGLNRYSRP